METHPAGEPLEEMILSPTERRSSQTQRRDLPPTPNDLSYHSESSVVWDTRRGDEIVLVPSPERSPRLVSELRLLHAGLVAIGTPPDEVWRLLAQVALDGMHRDRRRVLTGLVRAKIPLATSSVGGRLGLPASSVRRHLQALTALDVLQYVGDDPERWWVSPWVRQQWWAIEGACQSGLRL